MTKPNQTKRADTRQQILDIAKPIILRKGFAAVGLSEILKTANVPKGSFYHYFESKEQFGNALLEDYFEQYLTALDLSLSDKSQPALSRILNYFEAWKASQCDDTTKDRCMVVKLSGEVTDLSETMRLTLKQGTQQVIERITECMQEALSAQQIHIDTDAKTVTQELYYLWVGASLLTKVDHNANAMHVALKATHTLLGLKPQPD